MSTSSLPISTLGVPRIGPRRELKNALEGYWSGHADAASLLAVAKELRAASWRRQKACGITRIPSNDFSLYDHVLDLSAMVGAVPDLYGRRSEEVPLETYFAMARGTRGRAGGDLPALEMTKWFDTNYHFMVPEFTRGQDFTLGSTKPIDEFREAAGLGLDTRPALLGPVTYLKLGKSAESEIDPLSLLPGLLPVYAEVFRRLEKLGAEWVQVDEPCLVLDADESTQLALRDAYDTFARETPGLKIMLTTYFDGLGDNFETALNLPVAGLHLDLVEGPDPLNTVRSMAPRDLVLSLGVIDGRNIWRTDLSRIVDWLEPVVDERGTDHIEIAPSCSLLHVPTDLDLETELDPELKSWLAFAVQKMDELVVLGRALGGGRTGVEEALAASAEAAAARRTSPRIHDPEVDARVAAITPDMAHRESAFSERRRAQNQRLGLPAFPTTTIGSFPQTDEVRKARAAHRSGALNDVEYDAFLRHETEAAVRCQEEVGIDVLVHGEFERNDMVQYFGEKLAGYAFTQNGWVQSYGSRCVRPPILFGDVSRPKPMTVDWSTYAQSLTQKPVKGMLTGPVTMLQWSFVRDDLPRAQVCRQVALALRDEVADLEESGIRVIQIDEPALREGLPLRRSKWPAYLEWAVECFRLAASAVADDTQIHTHMCYAEFNDIIHAIAALDADVISIESSRSKMELLDAFATFHYPNEIGPGVYDIHSPRVPETQEMVDLLRKASQWIAPDQIWVNPDCGLKTRSWDEVRPALAHMVEAARQLRTEM